MNIIELEFKADTPGEAELWVKGVEYLKQQTVEVPYHALIDIMLRREFTDIHRLGPSNQPDNKV